MDTVTIDDDLDRAIALGDAQVVGRFRLRSRARQAASTTTPSVVRREAGEWVVYKLTGGTR